MEGGLSDGEGREHIYGILCMTLGSGQDMGTQSQGPKGVFGLVTTGVCTIGLVLWAWVLHYGFSQALQDTPDESSG